jgi:diguanylate cyclase (GGDEF)-like protein/putative nucleotidyltransferase with HDIG domain
MTRSRSRLTAYALLGAAVFMLAGYAAHAQFTLGGHGLDGFFQKWVNDAVVLVCSAVCLLRAWSQRGERVAWLMLSLAMASWALGNVYYSVDLINRNPLPIPSVADGLWLGIYPFSYIGVALLLRSRLATWRTSMWLDSLIAATAVAAVSADVVVATVVRSSVHASTAALITNIAYPIGDLVLLAMAVGAIALEGWRADRTWFALTAGFAAFTVTDGLFLVKTANGSYQVGTMIDAGWLLAAVLIAWAAWQPITRSTRPAMDGWRFVIMPIAFALVALVMLAKGGTGFARPWTAGLASITVLGVLARLALTFREYMRMVHRSDHEASTDALTGLGNRRRLLSDLEDAGLRASREVTLAFGLFDLDGFKPYNDTYGHPAGDALLARLGGQLRTTVGLTGSAYRMGGDEFCVLIACQPGEAQAVVARAAAALREEGEGFQVRASWGGVELPAETTDPTDTLRIADQRMYQNKLSRRSSAGEEIAGALMQALTEHSPGLVDHMSGVAELAQQVASELDLTADEVADVRRAAELHDIGKIAIPAAILDKHGPLSADEWKFIKRHTLIGERILRAAPSLHRVGQIVRSSHERYDGRGYPDGLAGDSASLGARIITVCDAYNAMTSDRPYGATMSTRDALAELRRCSGSQFDPHVVDTFHTVMARRSQAPNAAGSASALLRSG